MAFSQALALALMLAAAACVIAGFVGAALGRSSRYAQKMMRARIVLQAVAIACVMIAAWVLTTG